MLPAEAAWSLTLPATPSAAAAMDGDRVYVPLRDARLLAVDREEGTVSWSRVVHSTHAPVVAAATVYVLHESSLRALDAATGDDRWRVVLDGMPLAPPAVIGELVLAITEPGQVMAVQAATGEQRWQRPLAARALHPPVGAGSLVYVTTADSRVLALSAEDGHVVWEQTAAGTLSASAVGRERVFVGSTDNWLYAFDADSGDLKWRMRGGGDVVGAVADVDLVYAVSLDNIVRALNQGNGNQRWKKQSGTRPTQPPIAFGGLVLIPGLTPAATLFNARTGAALGSLLIDKGTLLGPPLIDPSLVPYRVAIVTLTREGVLEGLRPAALMFREPVTVPIAALPGRPLTRESLSR